MHIDAAQFSVLPSLCPPEVVREPHELFRSTVEPIVTRADENKALNAIRMRCGLGAVVVRAEVASIDTESDWEETLVCVPFYRSSFEYEGVTYELLIHGVSGACVGTRPYGTGALGTLGKKVMLGIRAIGEWVGLVDPAPSAPPAAEQGNNNNW